MKFRSIYQKLLAFAAAIMLGAVVVFCCVSVTIIIMSSSRHFKESKNSIETALIGKGNTLVVNNSVALRGMVEENAYSAIREIVATTVQGDSDVIRGIFMDTNRVPWVIAANSSDQMYRDHLNSAQPLNDSLSLWAQGINAPTHRMIMAPDGKPSFIAFVAPVIGSNGNKLGVIRYGLSTRQMTKLIAEEEKNSRREAVISISVYFCIAAGIFIIGLYVARRQANAITAPIAELTNATNAIAHGNYSLPLKVLSDDEIGSLTEHFEKMRLTVKEYTGNLEKMVADRTRDLQETQNELVEKAHKAGMADIAVGTLHNVGNILNSVKASVEVINDTMHQCPFEDFVRANDLLRENMATLDEFIRNDPRGKKLMQYYLKLEVTFKATLDLVLQNTRRLAEKVNTINDVIAAQQSYASVGGLSEKIRIADVIEDALTIQSASIVRHGITVVRKFQTVPEIIAQKMKLVNVLVNLIKNAKDAMIGMPPEKKTLVISVAEEAGTIYMRFIDTGSGIAQENINKIFSHGFTTKKDGHGFGLHSSANYMKEMGGEMWAESEGAGKGAQFIIKFPKPLAGT
jgi:signal transduction histidine kinase